MNISCACVCKGVNYRVNHNVRLSHYVPCDNDVSTVQPFSDDQALQDHQTCHDIRVTQNERGGGGYSAVKSPEPSLMSSYLSSEDLDVLLNESDLYRIVFCYFVTKRSRKESCVKLDLWHFVAIKWCFCNNKEMTTISQHTVNAVN